MKYRLVFWCVLPVCLLMLFFCGEGILHRSAQTKPLQTGSISVPYSETIQKWYTQLQVQLGNRQRNGVYIGEAALYVLPKSLSTESLQQTAGCINRFYDTYQISTCVIAIPDAASFYAEDLPDGMPLVQQKPQIKQFYNAIDMHIRKTDAYYILEAEADDYIYYRTFPYWTSYGAYSVYRSAIQKLGFVPISYDHYTVSHVKNDAKGTLYQLCQYEAVTPDLIDIYENVDSRPVCQLTTYALDGTSTKTDTLYDAAALETEDAYRFYLGGEAPLQIVTTDAKNGKRLLVIKDAWANCMIPFLAQHYEEICLVDIQFDQALTTLIPDITTYQQVLFLCHIDTYANTEQFKQVLSVEQNDSHLVSE